MIPFTKKYINSPKIILPQDVRIHGRKILDIGPKTITDWQNIIKKSKTIIWSGSPGLFEKRGFEKGTKAIWEAIIARSRNKETRIVVGGGETVASLKIKNQNAKIKISKNLFLSTGGGAMLDFLSDKKLPGLQALN